MVMKERMPGTNSITIALDQVINVLVHFHQTHIALLEASFSFEYQAFSETTFSDWQLSTVFFYFSFSNANRF